MAVKQWRQRLRLGVERKSRLCVWIHCLAVSLSSHATGDDRCAAWGASISQARFRNNLTGRARCIRTWISLPWRWGQRNGRRKDSLIVELFLVPLSIICRQKPPRWLLRWGQSGISGLVLWWPRTSFLLTFFWSQRSGNCNNCPC